MNLNMNLKIFKDKRLLFIIFLVSFICINILLASLIYNKNSTIIKERTITLSLYQENGDDEWVKEPHEDEQWIENPDFEDDEGWSKEIGGDVRDIDADITGGEANYIISGESDTFEALEGIIKNETEEKYRWHSSTHPNIDSPPTKGYRHIAGAGLYASHNWSDYAQDNPSMVAYQRASIQWSKIIKTKHDMSDYNITTASLEIKVNATVLALPGRIASFRRFGNIE